MSAEVFLLYLTTWTLVALAPGPAMLCCMAQSTRHGFRAGLAGVSGVQAGNLLFFLFVALGLGALLATATVAFTILRFLGAVYLFYLGLRIIVSTIGGRRDEVQPSEPPAVSRGGLFLQGFLIQLTNPKALLFVSALLPQFIDPVGNVPLQLVVLAAATVAVDTVVLSGYAWLGQKGVRSTQSSRVALWLRRAYGGALLFFGLRLLNAKN